VFVPSPPSPFPLPCLWVQLSRSPVPLPLLTRYPVIHHTRTHDDRPSTFALAPSDRQEIEALETRRRVQDGRKLGNRKDDWQGLVWCVVVCCHAPRDTRAYITTGRVKIAQHIETKQYAAIKIVSKHALITSRMSITHAPEQQEKIMLGIEREIVLMKLIDHPNVLSLYDVYETSNDL
jgi:hypothetical protein